MPGERALDCRIWNGYYLCIKIQPTLALLEKPNISILSHLTSSGRGLIYSELCLCRHVLSMCRWKSRQYCPQGSIPHLPLKDEVRLLVNASKASHTMLSQRAVTHLSLFKWFVKIWLMFFFPYSSQWEQFCLPEDIWQSLKTFLFVTLGSRYQWYLVSRDQGCCYTSYGSQDRFHNKESPTKMFVMLREKPCCGTQVLGGTGLCFVHRWP